MSTRSIFIESIKNRDKYHIRDIWYISIFGVWYTKNSRLAEKNYLKSIKNIDRYHILVCHTVLEFYAMFFHSSLVLKIFCNVSIARKKPGLLCNHEYPQNVLLMHKIWCIIL